MLVNITYDDIQKALDSGKIESNMFDDDIIASSWFAYLMSMASNTFVNLMMLGGSYMTNQEDKMLVMNNLREILTVIDKYYKK